MSFNTLTNRLYPLKRTWQQLSNIFQLYRHQERLEGLKAWAKRKKLKGVYTHYQTLYTNIEILLSTYQMRSPLLTFWAGFLYSFYDQLRPEPAYYQGYAAMYSRKGRAT